MNPISMASGRTVLASSSMSLAEARHIVRDLFAPNPAIYWADFLASTIAGATLFVLTRRVLEPFSVWQGLAFVACGLCFYRSVMFTHELVHLRDKSFRGFRVAWNLLCGIPFLMPSFMYYTHVDHHMRKHFGTKHDGEYMQLAHSSPWQIVIYLCQPLVIPILAILRFLILAPLSWMSPKLRDLVHRHCSAMVMDPAYIRPLPTKKVLRIMRLQEVLCFLWVAGIAVLLLLGVLPVAFPLTAYALSVMLLYINAFRTLGAHRYIGNGREQTFVEQLLDSVNYPNRKSLAPLWAPVGLRYHALHHLFPSLPYHNLGQAHERLMAELPADSPYRQTVSPSLPASLARLWQLATAPKGDSRRQLVRRPPSVGAGSQSMAN